NRAHKMTKKGHLLLFVTTVSIMLVCIGLISIFSGYKHEVVKFKTMLASLVIVLVFQYLLADPCKFVFMSVDKASWPPKIYIPQKLNRPVDDIYERREYLKLRLNMEQDNLVISSQYRHWLLNEQYKVIAADLLIYGQYFLCLMCLIMVTRDETLYHNTRIINDLFMNNHTDYYGLKEIYHINQLFDFIESSLVVAFNANSTMGMGWVHAEQTMLMGVIRLRQVRLADPRHGWQTPEYAEMYYMPDWQLPYRKLHYADKYWRIFEPWIPVAVGFEFIDGLLMNFEHNGYLHSYPELVGYVSLLARSQGNSMKVLDYLTEYNWLTLNTSAVFIDFTLYNVDANLFSICTLRVEKTPYGGLLPHIQVESVKLIEDVDQMPYTGLLALLIYIVVLIQFSQTLAIKLWYEPKLLKSWWNKLDLFIFLLNVMVVVLVVLREALVKSMMVQVAAASKMEFIDFRRPARMHQLATIFVGFLICITTLRLWRVLQFSSMFQLFSRTLFLAWSAVASTAMVILFFLLGYCFAVVTINGNNSGNFNKIIKSMVMCMCFTFGFSNQVKPSELFYGGECLGIILYAILAFVIAVLLINVFVSLINDYFSTAKAQRDSGEHDERINFFQFLRVEFPRMVTCFQQLPFFRRHYVRNNRTVSENVRHRLDEMDRREGMRMRKRRGFTSYDQQMPTLGGQGKSQAVQEILYHDNGEKMIKMAQILGTQMELLALLLFEDDPLNADDVEAGGDPSKFPDNKPDKP
ncbi:hypothetical protein KR018_008745, partial [Drosophila ironensis]